MKIILFLIFVISQCSQICFPGERISTVRCSRINARGEIEQVADIQCDNKQKPAVLTEPCNEERTSDNCKGEDKQINVPAMHVILKTYPHLLFPRQFEIIYHLLPQLYLRKKGLLLPHESRTALYFVSKISCKNG